MSLTQFTSKAVLILGRFSPERRTILDRLRAKNHLPIMFDFDKPESQDTISTIRTLAGMSKFVVADLTEAKSVVQELQAIVPDFPSVAVRFIILKSEPKPPMLDSLMRRNKGRKKTRIGSKEQKDYLCGTPSPMH
jgi:hypothetical protein